MAILHITNENFDELVLKSDKPVLLDFWATWCGPCQMLSPVVDSFAEENPDISVCKVNVDEENALAAQFGVMSIPTLVVMENGEVKRTSVGFKPKKDVLALLD